MRFYFEVEKRAARLEKAGAPPTARTPIILAIDEFQNISDLKLLDTIPVSYTHLDVYKRQVFHPSFDDAILLRRS